MRPGDMNPQLQMLMRNPQQQTLATSELARKAMQNNGQRNVQGYVYTPLLPSKF